MAGQVCARGGRGHDCARAHRLDWSHVLTTPLSSYAPMLRVIAGTVEIVLQISIISPDTSACKQTHPPCVYDIRYFVHTQIHRRRYVEVFHIQNFVSKPQDTKCASLVVSDPPASKSYRWSFGWLQNGALIIAHFCTLTFCGQCFK